jgi:hypothetical protein
MKTLRQIIHLAAFFGVVVVMIIPTLILLCMADGGDVLWWLEVAKRKLLELSE